MAFARETLVFDRVFDVQRTGGGWEKRTQFSFQSGEHKVYGVTVPGWPELVQGHRITSLLAEDGNWQSLLGWKNHETGEVVSPGAPPVWDGVMRLLVVTVAAFQLWAIASWRLLALAAGMVLIGLGVRILLKGRRARRLSSDVRLALQQIPC